MAAREEGLRTVTPTAELPLALSGSLTLADAYVLVSPWKPVLQILPIAAWAWLISGNYDKHASRFHLDHKKWNAFHLVVGLVAFAVAVLMPIEGALGFWIGLVAEIAILAISVAAYPLVANKDERVPDDHHVKIDFSHIQEAREGKKLAKQAGTAELVIKAESGALASVPDKESPEFQVRVAAEGVLLRGKAARASEVVVRPTGQDSTYGVVFTVDGIAQADTTLPAADAVKIIDYWKQAAGLDVNDRRRKQTSVLRVNHGEFKHKVRLSTAGGQAGMIMNLMVDPDLAVRRKFAELGLLEAQQTAVRELVEDGAGVVILASPADNGGTTLLYAMMKQHDAYTQNVQTIETDAQDQIEGVRQNRFDPSKEGQEHSTLVRSILRRDPDVVGIGDLTDAATAAEICKSDTERTRTYVLVRAGGALQGIQTWCKAAGDLQTAGDALHGAMACRLVRKLCPNCRVGYTPSPDMLKKLGLPGDRVQQLFKKGGQVLIKNKPETCPMCGGVGYFGQEGLLEVFPIGSAERELIKSGNLAALRAEFRKRGHLTIQQAALMKAVEGITSIEEIMRVTASEAPKQKKQPQQA